MEGLRNMETASIEYLMGKVGGTVRNMVRTSGQPLALVHDLLHDGLIVLIEKISDGNFDVTKSLPQTYLVGICRRLLANHLRLKKLPTVYPLEYGLEIQSDDLRDFLEHKDRLELLKLLLEQLGPPGNDLIRLKYLEGYSDEEQITQSMTNYTTMDSLRTSRSQYMKKLAIMAQDWKEKYYAR